MLRGAYQDALNKESAAEELLLSNQTPDEFSSDSPFENLAKATYAAAVDSKLTRPFKTTPEALIKALSMFLTDKINYATSIPITSIVRYAADRDNILLYQSSPTGEYPAFLMTLNDLQQWHITLYQSVDFNFATDLDFNLYFFIRYLNQMALEKRPLAQHDDMPAKMFPRHLISAYQLKMGERLGNTIDEALKIINSKSDPVVVNILFEIAQQKFNFTDEEKEKYKQRNLVIKARRYKVSYENARPELGDDCFEGWVYENGFSTEIDLVKAANCYLKVIASNNNANDVRFALEQIYKLFNHQEALTAIVSYPLSNNLTNPLIPLLCAAVNAYQTIIDTHFDRCITSPLSELEQPFNHNRLDNMYRIIFLAHESLRKYESHEGAPEKHAALTTLERMTSLEFHQISAQEIRAAIIEFPQLADRINKTYQQKCVIEKFRKRIYELVCAFERDLFNRKFEIIYATLKSDGDPKNIQILKSIFDGGPVRDTVVGGVAGNIFNSIKVTVVNASSLFSLILDALRTAIQGTRGRLPETDEFYHKWLAEFENIPFFESRYPSKGKLSVRAGAIRNVAKNHSRLVSNNSPKRISGSMADLMEGALEEFAFLRVIDIPNVTISYQDLQFNVSPNEILEVVEILATEGDLEAIEFLINNLGYTSFDKEKTIHGRFQINAELLVQFILDKYKQKSSTDTNYDLHFSFCVFKNYLCNYVAHDARNRNVPRFMKKVSELCALVLAESNLLQFDSRLGDTSQDALNCLARLDDDILIIFHLAHMKLKFNLTHDLLRRYFEQHKDAVRRVEQYSVSYEMAANRELSNEYLLAYAFQFGLNRPNNLNLAVAKYLIVIKEKENAESVALAIDRLQEILPGNEVVCADILKFYANENELDPGQLALLNLAVDQYQNIIDGYFKSCANITKFNAGVPDKITHINSMHELIVAAQKVLALNTPDAENGVTKSALLTLAALINFHQLITQDSIQQAQAAIPVLTQQVMPTYLQRMVISDYSARMRTLTRTFRRDLNSQQFSYVNYLGAVVSGNPKTTLALRAILETDDSNDLESIFTKFSKIFLALKEAVAKEDSKRQDSTDQFYTKWLAKFEELQFIYKGINPRLVILNEVEDLELSDLYLVWRHEEIDLKVKLACAIRLYKLDADFNDEFTEVFKIIPSQQFKTTYVTSRFGLFGSTRQVADSEYACIYAIAFACAALDTDTNLFIVKDTLKDCFTPSMTKALSALPYFLRGTFLTVLSRSQYWPESMVVPQTGAELGKIKEQFRYLVITATPFDYDLAFQSLCKRTPLGKLFDKENGALATATKGTKHAILEALDRHILSYKNCSKLMETTRLCIHLEFAQDSQSLKFLQEKYPAVFKVIDETIRSELNNKKALAPAPATKVEAAADVFNEGDPRAKPFGFEL